MRPQLIAPERKRLVSMITTRCSETLHRFGFGSKPGSVGGVFGSVGPVPPLQPPSIPTAVATLQIASCTILPYAGVLARALTEVPPTRIATRANAAAYSRTAAPRSACRERRTRRANMAARSFPVEWFGVEARPQRDQRSWARGPNARPRSATPFRLRGTYPDGGGRAVSPVYPGNSHCTRET